VKSQLRLVKHELIAKSGNRGDEEIFPADRDNEVSKQMEVLLLVMCVHPIDLASIIILLTDEGIKARRDRFSLHIDLLGGNFSLLAQLAIEDRRERERERGNISCCAN
jgi:hypothetical protein